MSGKVPLTAFVISCSTIVSLRELFSLDSRRRRASNEGGTSFDIFTSARLRFQDH